MLGTLQPNVFRKLISQINECSCSGQSDCTVQNEELYDEHRFTGLVIQQTGRYELMQQEKLRTLLGHTVTQGF